MPQFDSNPPLDIGDLDADPLAQLQRWLTDAIAVPMQEPTAMTLASVDAHGRPSARGVLFKGFHGDGLDRGLTIYTNYESRQGERKSFVAGTRGAVRVAPGGSRIKKKK